MSDKPALQAVINRVGTVSLGLKGPRRIALTGTIESTDENGRGVAVHLTPGETEDLIRRLKAALKEAKTV